MAANPVVCNMKQGEDTPFLITCYSNNPPTSIFNLSGYTNPECQIRKTEKITSDLALYTPTVTFNSPQSLGQVTFTVPGVVSILWNQFKVYFDVFVYDPSGNRLCIAEGSILIDPSTTLIGQ